MRVPYPPAPKSPIKDPQALIKPNTLSWIWKWTLERVKKTFEHKCEQVHNQKDEYDKDGSVSGSPGNSVGSADDKGFGDVVPTGIESLGGIVVLDLFVPIGVDSKGSWLIGSFRRPKDWSTILFILVSSSRLKL